MTLDAIIKNRYFVWKIRMVDEKAIPATTDFFLGHELAEAEFLSAWNSERIAHAWLITGPKGIGKATLAYRIARFVLVQSSMVEGLFGGRGDFQENPSNLHVDCKNPVFRRIAAGSHADLRVLEREWTDDHHVKRKSEISVESVREMGTFLSMTPAEGKWRVVLVDSVDEMSRSAANAILKLLEEPPRNVLLLLVTHSPGRVLPTIRSRCRKLALKKLSTQDISKMISFYRPDLPQEDRLILAGLAEGSIGHALSLADNDGVALYNNMLEFLAELPRLDNLKLHGFAEQIGRDEQSFHVLGQLLDWWLARAAAMAAGKTILSKEIVPGEFDLQNMLVSKTGLDRWIELWEKINRLFERTDAVNLDRKQIVMSSFFAMERSVSH